MSTTTTATRCFQALANACLEEDYQNCHKNGGSRRASESESKSELNEEACKSLCALASTQPHKVTLAVKSCLDIGDVFTSTVNAPLTPSSDNHAAPSTQTSSNNKSSRRSFGWRGVRRLLIVACQAAKSVENIARRQKAGTTNTAMIADTPSGYKMTDEEVNETVVGLVTISVHEMIDGDPENTIQNIWVKHAREFERSDKGSRR